MFANGFSIRGGISLGNVYHQKDLVFGPALNEAYNLEVKCTVYPRIVITEDNIRKGLTKNPLNSPEEEMRSVLGMLQKDSDGLYYVDFLNQRTATYNDAEYALLLNKARAMIAIGLSLQDVSILQKYEWLKTKYNAAIVRQGFEEHSPLL